MSSYILHIETSTSVCSVALSKEKQLIALKETDHQQYNHSEQLTLFIEEVLQRATITPKELNAVSVSAGPGSYTGLRVGTSTAKGLCYGLNIPLIAISSLENLAVEAHKKYPEQRICTLIDARRMEVFSAIYSPDKLVIKTPSSDILYATTYSEYEPFVVVGNGAIKIAQLWENRNLHVDLDLLLSASTHAEGAFERYTNNNFESVAYFEPTYLKEWQNM